MFTICIMIGTSYAWWTSTANQTGINEIQSTCIEMKLTDEKDEINLEYAYPLTDEEAKKLKPFTFTIKNTCNTIVDYTVKLEQLKKNGEEDTHLLNSQYVAVEFNGGQKQLLSEYPEGVKTYKGNEGYTSIEARELIKGTLEGSATKEYKIKLWMDESVEATQETMNKSFISKIVVDGSINEVAVYDEPILHGADPVLESSNAVAMQTASEESTTTDKLIPVIINEENGKVTRANLAHDWYNYEEKRWANAVILADGATEPEVGKEIPEEQIESYFVWIPKYKYKLFDMGAYENANSKIDEAKQNKAIEIKFGIEDTKNNSIECIAPASGENGECAVDKWMTHPAFTAFSDSNGMWVGKFETGYNQDTKNSDKIEITESWNHEGAKRSENDRTKVIIKPNVYSWSGMSLANMYYNSFNYQRELESHMMKNTEWGAVAYLTQSLYGRCKNINGSTTCTEVATNNMLDTITGYTNNKNYFQKSFDASTTGNYSGIYDMAGASYEIVMAIMMNSDGSMSTQFNDTIFQDIDKKYYDQYKATTYNRDYSKRILGDATGELGPFETIQNIPTGSYYGDGSYPLIVNNFFHRGGGLGDSENSPKGGIFNFGSGTDTSYLSFRIILTPMDKVS